MAKNSRHKTLKFQTLFSIDEKYPNVQFLFLKNLIEDRKSKFSVTFFEVDSEETVKQIIKNLRNQKFYRKATHNIYAYRIKMIDWSILEGKNDDGEVWWWNCVLKILRENNLVNWLVIVTRYYWGIHLNSDRFRHILNATKIIVEKVLH